MAGRMTSKRFGNGRLGEANAKAAAARTRMAKRAKRARFLKENKKRILYGAGGTVLVLVLALLTPIGPDWYYGNIQLRKFQSSGVIAPGALQDLYGLGTFYLYSFRKDKALECFDEVTAAYFGFKMSEYALNPDDAMIKRDEYIKRKASVATFYGPPFTVSDQDISAVALALWRYDELNARSKQFTGRVYQGLYMDEILAKHPDKCDPEVTEAVKVMVDRLSGRR